MTFRDITDFLDKKIELDEHMIIITFYEVRIKLNLSKNETDIFLLHSKTRLENLGYNVFFSGTKFLYKDDVKVVADNQLMIAIKI